MAIRNIRYDNDPILRKRCKEVKTVDDKIRLLLDDMAETLKTGLHWQPIKWGF